MVCLGPSGTVAGKKVQMTMMVLPNDWGVDEERNKLGRRRAAGARSSDVAARDNEMIFYQGFYMYRPNKCKSRIVSTS